MSKTVTCQCGAEVRLPEGAGDRKFRCPICKLGIAVSTDSAVLSSTRLDAGASGIICPICQSPISAGEDAVKCPMCEQIHHRECWAEVGGCGTYGCDQAPSAEMQPDAQQPMSAWGDMKSCPVCGERIKSIAVHCRYCHTDFGTVNPLTTADLNRRAVKDAKTKQLQNTIVVLFVLTLIIGCLAPLWLIVNLAVLLPQRKKIDRLEPLFKVLAYSSVVLSVVYSILMLFFGLASAL